MATAKVDTVMMALPMNWALSNWRSAAVEQALQCGGIIGSQWAGCAVLAAGEQAE